MSALWIVSRFQGRSSSKPPSRDGDLLVISCKFPHPGRVARLGCHPFKAEIAGPIPRVLPKQSVCEVFANRPDGSESNGYRVLKPLQF